MIFADTVYLFALLSPDDQWHGQAAQISRTSREPILTTRASRISDFADELSTVSIFDDSIRDAA